MEDIVVKNVDAEDKRKAMFVLKTDGKNLSEAVREMLKKYAKEFEKRED